MSTEIYELTDDENLALEAAQEQRVVYASDVVDYAWKEYEITWPREKATRLLSRLTHLGLLRRHPRVSLGWGQGWYPSAYEYKRS